MEYCAEIERERVKGFISRPLPSLNLSLTDVDFSAAVGGGGDALVRPAAGD